METKIFESYSRISRSAQIERLAQLTEYLWNLRDQEAAVEVERTVLLQLIRLPE